MTSCYSTHHLSNSNYLLHVLVIDTDALFVPLIETMDAFVDLDFVMPS